MAQEGPKKPARSTRDELKTLMGALAHMEAVEASIREYMEQRKRTEHFVFLDLEERDAFSFASQRWEDSNLMEPSNGTPPLSKE